MTSGYKKMVTFILSIVGAALIQICTQGPLAAESDAVKGEGISMLKALDVAAEYSKRNRGIGVTIFYGGAPGMPSADVIGERLLRAFDSESGGVVKVAYFIVPTETPGAAASYSIEDVIIGPFGGKDAFANVEEALRLRRGADSILYPSAPNM